MHRGRARLPCLVAALRWTLFVDERAIGILENGDSPATTRGLGGSARESNPPCRRSRGAPSALKAEPSTSPGCASARECSAGSPRLTLLGARGTLEEEHEAY